MFRQLASNFTSGYHPGDADTLFLYHPSILTMVMEIAWQKRVHEQGTQNGLPFHKSDLPAMPYEWFRMAGIYAKSSPTLPPPDSSQGISGTFWDHLIYAYMIENTGIYEIFRRVLHEFLYGERLGTPMSAAQHWLRNTEELIYRDPPPFSIRAITSYVRPDLQRCAEMLSQE